MYIFEVISVVQILVSCDTCLEYIDLAGYIFSLLQELLLSFLLCHFSFYNMKSMAGTDMGEEYISGRTLLREIDQWKVRRS